MIYWKLCAICLILTETSREMDSGKKKITKEYSITSLDFIMLSPVFDLLQFSCNFITLWQKDFLIQINYINRFATTLTSTIDFLTRGLEDLILSYIWTKLCDMDFDYLNYVTSAKLKKVNDKNVKSENKFLNPIWMSSQNNTRY